MKRVHDTRKITCPTCRVKIRNPPHESINMKNIVDRLVSAMEQADSEQYANLEKERQIHVQEFKQALAKAGDDPSKMFESVFGVLTRHIVDREDRVQRCARCHWELDDNYCRNCDRYAMSGSDDAEFQDMLEEIEYLGDGNYDEGDSIDVDEEEDEEELSRGNSEYSDEEDGHTTGRSTTRGASRRSWDRFDERARELLDEEAAVSDGQISDDEEEFDDDEMEIRGHYNPQAARLLSDEDDTFDGDDTSAPRVRRNIVRPDRQRHRHLYEDEEENPEDDEYGSMDDFIADDNLPELEESHTEGEDEEEEEGEVENGPGRRRRKVRITEQINLDSEEDENDPDIVVGSMRRRTRVDHDSDADAQGTSEDSMLEDLRSSRRQPVYVDMDSDASAGEGPTHGSSHHPNRASRRVVISDDE